MKKGYLIFFALIFALMTFTPLLALRPKEEQKPPQQKTENQNQSFKLLMEDGSVKELSAKEYIFGVVAAEMSADSPKEALKAQAVAAFTFAMERKTARETSPPADLKGADLYADSSKDQGFLTRDKAREKWGERADEYEKNIDDALKQTAGISLRYEGKYASALYHAISGGRTESAENVFGSAVPYLVSVQSAGDILQEGYCTSKTVTFEEFFSLLNGFCGGSLTFCEDYYGGKECTDSGTVKTMTLFGNSFTGRQMRDIFSLRSANFDIETDGDKKNITFTVRGYGHLVGMSQAGAKTMAQNGADFREILLHYYPGCEIVG